MEPASSKYSSSGLDSSESPKFFSLERSLSSSPLTKGFLSRFKQGNRRNESLGGDELGYLEGKSSVEGPASQRIHARIEWKVMSS